MHARGAKEELAILLPNTMSQFLPGDRATGADDGRPVFVVRMVASLGAPLAVALRRLSGVVGRRIMQDEQSVVPNQEISFAPGRESPSGGDRDFMGRTSAA